MRMQQTHVNIKYTIYINSELLPLFDDISAEKQTAAAPWGLPDRPDGSFQALFHSTQTLSTHSWPDSSTAAVSPQTLTLNSPPWGSWSAVFFYLQQALAASQVFS